MKLTVKYSSLKNFFAHGKKFARKLDTQKTVSYRVNKVLYFEDINDMLEILTPARLNLIRETKKKADSISGLARRLHRDRRAVARDIESLNSAGVLSVTEKEFSGHKLQKWITPVASSIKVEANI